jgi:hypothetical protein
MASSTFWIGSQENFISAEPFAQVNWASGYDAKGRPIFNPNVHYGSTSVSVSPGPGGAHNWSPMSFNPNTGLMYIPTTPTSNYSYSVVPNFNPQPPCMNAGVPGFACPEAGPAPAAAARGGAAPPAAGPMIGPAVPQGARGGFLMAWDPVKQKEAWRGAGGAGGGGGTVTTAGNLVFQVIQQGGRLVAYSADKGELLLDISTGQTGNMGPADHLHAGWQTVHHAARRKSVRRWRLGAAADYTRSSSIFCHSGQCSDECSRPRRSSRTWGLCRNSPVRNSGRSTCRSRWTRRQCRAPSSCSNVLLRSGRKSHAVAFGEFEPSAPISWMYSVGPQRRP